MSDGHSSAITMVVSLPLLLLFKTARIFYHLLGAKNNQNVKIRTISR